MVTSLTSVLCVNAASGFEKADVEKSSAQHNSRWWQQRFEDHSTSVSNAEKLHELFELYSERHKGKLPEANNWEEEIKVLAKEKRLDFHKIVARPLRGHPRRFVMNIGASGQNTKLLSERDAEDFVLFFENPIPPKHATWNATEKLTSASKVPTDGCKVVAFWNRSVESTCGPDTPSFGPFIPRTAWDRLIQESDKITAMLRQRNKDRI